MHQCCISNQIKRPQRRLHGLQLPLNYFQILGWIVFAVTALLNFLILTRIQFDVLQIASTFIFSLLYIFHTTSHLTALLLDPSESDLRKQKLNTLPEFDHAIHAHVIENGRCHLCNINTSDKKTKHCGICNKCVYHFDHHCKWLNNCVGRRNYVAFILCVISALLIALFSSVLCLTNIITFFKGSYEFSSEAKSFINCTTNINQITIYCKKSIYFLIFLFTFFLSGIAISCALLHLLCFHIYISVLGVSTYEYIIKKSNNPITKHYQCCGKKKKRLYFTNQSKIKTDEEVGNNIIPNNEPSMTNFVNAFINQEINKAKKTFLYENNKVHPSQEEK